ncbi:MAG: hypothetical protein DRQ44_00825 [Gammaproteobacteria bacterium]|nr:MAG: hypothetical protein DRQ44_00825 [Gammaproteobacteria bacterium]
MEKQIQQNIHGKMRACDDHAKYLTQEAVSELDLLKLIDMSRELDAEEKVLLQTNIEIITKAGAKPV